jgi:hypothetical protein
MYGYEQVTQMIELYIKTLEGLEFSKKRDQALRLLGNIDACVQISGCSMTPWQNRLDRAMVQLMSDPPKPPSVPTELPPALRTAIADGKNLPSV